MENYLTLTVVILLTCLSFSDGQMALLPKNTKPTISKNGILLENYIILKYSRSPTIYKEPEKTFWRKIYFEETTDD